ncbi:MAG: S41 family peptidase [Chloroflexales bacterium]|nr:S41 family peptidase [Chloroflexales bacterium]
MVRTIRSYVISLSVALLVGIVAFISGWTARDVVGSVSVGTFVGTLVDGNGEAISAPDVRSDFEVFWEVWRLVEREFYHPEPLDQQQMVYGAIRGMLASLNDEYTNFQEPDVAAQNRESIQGKFEGIGAYLSVENNQIVIERPIKGSPAMQAGLQSGDIILKVDGAELASLIAGLSDAEAASRAATEIRGPKGSVVTLTLVRAPKMTPFDVDITRDEVPLITVNAQMLNDDVAYIQITEFKATTTAALDEALRELLPEQPQSLVLDLRNNPGGLLKTAQEVLGHFYDGIALYEEERDGSLKQLNTIRASRDVRVFDLPIVVLVNGNSASAAEIVAGALHDQRPNTTLLGEKSFGKGSVQNIHQLRDGSSVRITIAHWFTPNKSDIHTIGITPQYVVPASEDPQYAVPCVAETRPAEGQTNCIDSQLAWSLRFLKTQATPPPPTPTGGLAALNIPG